MREYVRDSVFSAEAFPALDLTINAARKPTFYYWNAFFLIFLITLASLSIFSIRCHLNANRIQTVCTLLLTSVTFKWITNRYYFVLESIIQFKKVHFFLLFLN